MSKISRPIAGNADFSKLLAPYHGVEFIPSNVDILPILKAAYPSAEIIHNFSKSHVLVRVRVKDLLSAPIKNWHNNRPADISRCKDIAQYFYRTRKYIDSEIYMNLVHKKNIFEIFDGIHRYESLSRVKDCIEDYDHTTSYGIHHELAWLYESYIILNIRISATEGEIIEAFQTLNKSNPVPELYTLTKSADKRICIDEIIEKLQHDFKPIFTLSQVPVRPNVNRNQLVNLLDKVYDKMDINIHTRNKLEQAIYRLNHHVSENILSSTGKAKPTEKMLKKCNETGCYLFLYSLESLEDMLCHA